MSEYDHLNELLQEDAHYEVISNPAKHSWMDCNMAHISCGRLSTHKGVLLLQSDVKNLRKKCE